ncbi:MAG: glycosyltransferase [Ruminococcaceae bacterium]|nr:glycosyltransferase [Oscillospiraceae bacterium]
MKLSVVIPVYNEEKRIKETSEVLDSFLKTIVEDYEIIFSNDGSVDSTPKILDEISRNNPKIKAIGYDVNKGKGSAVRCGVLASTGDYVVFTDCDLAYGTEVIKRAIDVFEECECDVVIGSRNIDSESYEGYTFTRKIMSKVYFRIISLASGFKLSDSQCGFKCFKKEAGHDVFSECQIDSFAFDLEALMKSQAKGYKICEMPVKIINNDNSESKVRMIRDAIKMLFDIRRIKKNNRNN